MRFISVPHLKIVAIGGVFIVTAEALAVLHFTKQSNIAEASLVLLHWCDRYLHRVKSHETTSPIR